MKRSIALPGILLFSILMLQNWIYAQSGDDFINTLINQIDKYFIAQPHDNIYLQTDKSVYFSGEEVLYRIVANEAATLAPSVRSNKCIISILDAKGQVLISISSEIPNGFARGSIKLPLNTNEGSYHLIAYTMKDNLVTANKVFTKEIFITNPDNKLMMDYQFDQEFYIPAQELNLNLKAYSYRSKPLSKVKIRYDIRIGDKIVNSGTGKTLKSGAFNIAYQIPDFIPGIMVIDVSAGKRKLNQKMNICVPFAKAVEQKVVSPNSRQVGIEIKEFNDNKIRFGVVYNSSKLNADKSVIIALFRKGLLYWSAPGKISQAGDISIPLIRIPSGILDLVIFDPGGYILVEKMLYFERNNKPYIEVNLDKDTYHSRKEVSVGVSIAGNINNIPEDTYLSVSVSAKDMVRDVLLLDDQMLIDVDVKQDTRSFLISTRQDKERNKIIQRLLNQSDRNGYTWNQILHPEKLSETPLTEEDIFKNVNVLYYPSNFNASKMRDYSRGITDKRFPNAQLQNYQRQLETGTPILEVIKTIKPYSLYGNKIVFTGKVNSLYAQQGAIIVINNQMIGEDATILNSISPTDVETINISTNAGDIQRYTGLNSIGVIEINLKGYGPGSRLVEKSSRDEDIKESNGNYLPGYPDYSNESDVESVIADYRSLLYWKADLQPGDDKKAFFHFYTPDIPGTYVITVQGMIGALPLAVRKEFEVH